MSKKKSKGLGDTVDKITTKTGIKKAIKKLFGEDCGCTERKELLNRLFPYHNEIIDCSDYQTLDKIKPWTKNNLSSGDYGAVLGIYRKYIDSKQEYTNCVPCVKNIVAGVERLYIDYNDEMENLKKQQ